MRPGRTLIVGAALTISWCVTSALAVVACEDNGINPDAHPPKKDASTTNAVIAGDGGRALEAFSPPADPGPGGILVSASGEVLALTGFKFPPNDPANDTYMVDGWNFTLDEYITVFDHVTLWDNPDMVPSDQSQHGGVVAHVDGPWVVDLHKGGPLTGKGGAGEEATPIVAIANKDDGSALDPATTYAFGFSTVAAPADYGAYNVNLDSAEADDFAYMVHGRYSVLYVGTATFVGAACTQSHAGPRADAGLLDAGGTGTFVDGGYDFTRLPQTLHFRMGFDTPTSYVNCQNGTDLAGPGLNGEDHPRGVQVQANQSVVAQVTIHMDHPFWESFAENSPLHWDQIAGQYVGVPAGTQVHTEDMKGVNFLAFTDRTGTPIPWRNCSGTAYTAPGGGQMNFDPLTVPVDPAATDPSRALRDYYDYIRYTQSTQGHLNSQGLCYIARQYPSPGR